MCFGFIFPTNLLKGNWFITLFIKFDLKVTSFIFWFVWVLIVVIESIFDYPIQLYFGVYFPCWFPLEVPFHFALIWFYWLIFQYFISFQFQGYWEKLLVSKYLCFIKLWFNLSFLSLQLEGCHNYDYFHQTFIKLD